jgi:hypothetical protein
VGVVLLDLAERMPEGITGRRVTVPACDRNPARGSPSRLGPGVTSSVATMWQPGAELYGVSVCEEASWGEAVADGARVADAGRPGGDARRRPWPSLPSRPAGVNARLLAPGRRAFPC